MPELLTQVRRLMPIDSTQYFFFGGDEPRHTAWALKICRICFYFVGWPAVDHQRRQACEILCSKTPPTRVPRQFINRSFIEPACHQQNQYSNKQSLQAAAKSLTIEKFKLIPCRKREAYCVISLLIDHLVQCREASSRRWM